MGLFGDIKNAQKKVVSKCKDTAKSKSNILNEVKSSSNIVFNELKQAKKLPDVKSESGIVFLTKLSDVKEAISNQVPLVFFDVETTGLNKISSDPSEGHKVIQIGLLKLLDYRDLDSDSNESIVEYFNPKINIDEESIAVHGITNDMVKDADVFSNFIDRFKEFVDGCILVAHNANFDCSFINRELLEANCDFRLKDLIYRSYVIDTLPLARSLVKGSVSLDRLMSNFNIVIDRGNHDALIDSKILSKVFLNLITEQKSMSNLYDNKNEILKELDTNLLVRLKKVILTEEEERIHEDYLINNLS